MKLFMATYLYKLCKSHFGDVRFVGVKYHNKIGWIAKAQLGNDFENLTADGKTSTDALRKLRNRVKKLYEDITKYKYPKRRRRPTHQGGRL